MQSNANFDKNIRKYEKFQKDATYDEMKQKRNKFKKRKDVREDPITRYRNGHEA